MGIGIARLSSAMGAEVTSLDFARPLETDAVNRLTHALAEHCVLLIRNADITPEQHLAFSRHFGPLETHILAEFSLPDLPEILVISNVKEGGKLKGAIYAGQYWHSDRSYTEKPSLGSLLLCREMPAVGGDTMWTNMYMAYDTLSDVMKGFIGGLKAVHDYSNAYDTYFSKLPDRPPLTPEQRAKSPPVVHPVVRTHPVTGRKALYVNPGFTKGIVGMPDEESRPILDFLFRHSTRPEFTYRHKWRVNDMMFWDNRCSMHYAVSDYDSTVRRHMHRTTIAGDTPR
jgi:taurine dioxygenase